MDNMEKHTLCKALDTLRIAYQDEAAYKRHLQNIYAEAVIAESKRLVDNSNKQHLLKDSIIPALTRMHADKGAVYGDTWCRRGFVLSVYPNIMRKIDRLVLGNGGTEDESSLDTWLDLCNYFVLLLSVLEKLDYLGLTYAEGVSFGKPLGDWGKITVREYTQIITAAAHRVPTQRINQQDVVQQLQAWGDKTFERLDWGDIYDDINLLLEDTTVSDVIKELAQLLDGCLTVVRDRVAEGEPLGVYAV